MLDSDGDGTLSEDEFIGGPYRLVHCDDFQRDCIVMSACSRGVKTSRKVGESIIERLSLMEKRLVDILGSKVASQKHGHPTHAIPTQQKMECKEEDEFSTVV